MNGEQSLHVAMLAVVFMMTLMAAPRVAAQSIDLSQVQVVGTAPVPGIGTPLHQVPANVQTVTGRQIQRQQPLSSAQALSENVGSVNLNMGQENPYQPALN